MNESIENLRRKLLTTEEVFALNLKKGDKINFSNDRSFYGRVFEGEFVAIKKRRYKTGKTFNGRYWQDGEWKTGYELVAHVYKYDRKIAYDMLYVLEKIEQHNSDYENSSLKLIAGQTAEELIFNWTLVDLKDFASILKVKNRSKMSKAQLAMAIEDALIF